METDNQQQLLLQDLSRVNDLVSAIDNTTHKLVRCHDGTLLPLMYDGGSNPEDLNRDISDCKKVYDGLACEDTPPPAVFTKKFREDMIGEFYDAAVSQAVTGTPLSSENRYDNDFIDAFCRSLVPGLPSLKHTITGLFHDKRLDGLREDDINTFFSYRCTDSMCASKALWDGVKVNDDFTVDDPIPPPNVKHPNWFYYPEMNGNYATDVFVYIRDFLNEPSSHKCSACDVDCCLMDDDRPVDLFGLPETFHLNMTICVLYGLYTPSQKALNESTSNVVIRKTHVKEAGGARAVRYSVHNLSRDVVFT
ncbi:hypothetical protein ElyMa_003965800 [Elysia marginata]|uniref:Uncharacterized protein n=1 Tax=Elysia marginata TaxID=1093978 RepID=A0AAV4FWQ0_9GAST|nr:hypothetical protein ElyMa_003965800 [Elysia marginata]